MSTDDLMNWNDLNSAIVSAEWVKLELLGLSRENYARPYIPNANQCGKWKTTVTLAILELRAAASTLELMRAKMYSGEPSMEART